MTDEIDMFKSLMDVLSSLSMDNESTQRGILSPFVQNNPIDINELKDKTFSKVLEKIGLDSIKVQKLCQLGKGDDILTLIDRLNDTKAHDFLIVHTYPNGNYGYVTYKGTYESAKRHALSCLGREHGMFNTLPDENKYCVRKHPIYTLETDRVRIEVVPHGSWVSLSETDN